MDIIKNYKVGRENINIDRELKSNEVIIVCNHYIMEQLLKKGVTFKEMYSGVFIVTSLKGNPTLQDIEKINRVIRIYNPDLIDEGNLVSQMSEEKMDKFFKRYFWSDSQNKKMNIKKVEYSGDTLDIDPGTLSVTYQEGKRGREIIYTFGDGWTDLLGYTKDDVRIENVWDRYLFDETIKTWLEKNKLKLSLKVPDSLSVLDNKTDTNIARTIVLEENGKTH